MEREHLGSRLGFILLSAGCAIGLGNVYRFPMKAGQYGGGAFVLVYVLCLVLLGLPVMVMEFSLGRAAQKSPVYIYKTLTPEKKWWNIHGFVTPFGN
ncbi:MAG: sodium-dependent transporter, partial [Lachnospiraceae bacterium]|nr:sodium-dependent transporter [Lachnospiraceae bacterium]